MSSIRMIAFLFVIGVAVLAFVAWPKKPGPAPPPAAPAPADTGGTGIPGGGFQPAPAAGNPGLTWTVPKRWTLQGERPMRVATYAAPRTKGDSEDGECAVFYFGPNQGGGIEDNINRWVGQFENPGKPQRSTLTVHGLSISRVKVHGTYLAPSGPAMESQGTKPDFTLLGAIVTGPKGAVFFKFTGPAKTIEAAAAEFDRMLGSIKPS